MKYINLYDLGVPNVMSSHPFGKSSLKISTRRKTGVLLWLWQIVAWKQIFAGVLKRYYLSELSRYYKKMIDDVYLTISLLQIFAGQLQVRRVIFHSYTKKIRIVAAQN